MAHDWSDERQASPARQALGSRLGIADEQGLLVPEAQAVDSWYAIWTRSRHEQVVREQIG